MAPNRPTPPRPPDRRDLPDPAPGRSPSRFLTRASSRDVLAEGRPSPDAPTPERPEPRIDRRGLIAAGAVAGAGAVGGAIWLATRDGEGPTELPATQAAMASPRATTASDSTAAASTIGPGEPLAGERALVETTIADLSGYIERGQVSSAALIAAARERHIRYDKTYHAVIELNPEAAAIAARLDAELAQGQRRGPLHGMPVLLKDTIATDDWMRTTAGALALEDNTVVEDATIVRRLREAGAVLLGKANMSEWSGVRANGQVPGWSGRGGQTRNPYDPEMSTWGSSSGSAAAVALNYVPFAIGVETNGSIVAPAAACGIVGLKPTVGLVSRVGVMPVSTTWDSPGPMARNVADIAAVMNVIAGFDPEDPAYGELEWASPAATVGGSPVPEFDEVDYLEALDRDALRGARLGVCWQMWGIDEDADELAFEAIDRLTAELDVEIVENVPMPPLDEPEALEGSEEMVNAEFTAGMAGFFARFMPDGPILSLPEVAEWNAEHAEQALEEIGQDGLVETEWALSLDDEAYLEILGRVVTASREEGIDAVMDEYGLDALIAPTTGVPSRIDAQEPFPGAASKVSAISGYPGITVPMGQVRGLPVGLYLVGRAFSERQLIGYAYAIEQLLRARNPAKV